MIAKVLVLLQEKKYALARQAVLEERRDYVMQQIELERRGVRGAP